MNHWILTMQAIIDHSPLNYGKCSLNTVTYVYAFKSAAHMSETQ